MISVNESGNNDLVFLKMSESTRLTEFGLRKAWFAVGKDLLKSANKAVLAKPRKGRLYIFRGPRGGRRRHRASRPFESHANLTGKLRKSMQWKVRGRDLDFGYGVANAKAPDYAPFVENGTTRMEPRPTLKNAIEENKRNAEQHLLNFVAKEFK